MVQAKVGSSIAADAFAAGKEAASRAAVEGAKLVFAFSSCAYDQGAFLKGVAESAKGVPVVGCTSYTGVITPEGFVTGPNGYAAVMVLKDDALTVGTSGLAKSGTARETGRAAAEKAMKAAGQKGSPAYFYMTASPGEEEAYLKGVEDVIGRVPFFGGSAADNSVEGHWKVLFGQQSATDGIALAFFYTDKKSATVYTGDYDETSTVGLVTKVDGKRKLVEIDGKPALKRYAEWRGLNPDSLKGLALLGASITNPLGVKDRLGELVAIRHPMVGNDDYSMTLGSNVAEKTAVILMETTADKLIASTGKAVETAKKRLGKTPGAYLLVHCGGRRGGIGERIGEACASIKKAAGEVPFIGVCTFGEYGAEDWGNNTCGGLMLSFTAFEK